MILLLHGSDFEKTRKKLRELLDSLAAKKPDAEVFRVDDQSFDPNRLEELMESQGLFEKKCIVVLEKVFQNQEAKEEILESLLALKKSENIFILVEEGVGKTDLSKIEEKAEKVQEFSKSKPKTSKKEFNIFSLTEAFGRRDKKNLWILYQKALSEGHDPEEVHGILFWQLKSIILASSTKSSTEAGLKPFVYKKSLSFSKNYSEEEIKSLSSKMVEVYHNSRRGIFEFGNALELFILRI